MSRKSCPPGTPTTETCVHCGIAPNSSGSSSSFVVQDIFHLHCSSLSLSLCLRSFFSSFFGRYSSFLLKYFYFSLYCVYSFIFSFCCCYSIHVIRKADLYAKEEQFSVFFFFLPSLIPVRLYMQQWATSRVCVCLFFFFPLQLLACCLGDLVIILDSRSAALRTVTN